MIIFNITVFVAHSDRALRNPPCSNDVTYLKNAYGPAHHSSSCLLGKALDLHKVCQVWCAVEFLLIPSKTDKETFPRCINISEHDNSSRSGKLYPHLVCGNRTQQILHPTTSPLVSVLLCHPYILTIFLENFYSFLVYVHLVYSVPLTPKQRVVDSLIILTIHLTAFLLLVRFLGRQCVKAASTSGKGAYCLHWAQAQHSTYTCTL